MLEAEVVADQTNIIRLQNAGFVMKCTFEEYFMLPDGELMIWPILSSHAQRSPASQRRF
jgi:hypothetical protein